ncbi:MAG: ATP-binding protein [Deltaproteobacteria bacterium]
MPGAAIGRGFPGSSGKPPQGAREQRISVWIADDSPLQLEVARRALAPKCNVSAYADGLKLLEDLNSGLAPEVLVLDWQMPDLTGLEVCRFVRSSKDLAELPILVLTSKGGDSMAVEALAAGANDFLRIPFSPAELEARVSALVQVASLYAGLAKAEGRLRVEADFRERFMGMLAHDLRQPLNTMVLANRALSSQAAVSQAAVSQAAVSQAAVSQAAVSPAQVSRADAGAAEREQLLAMQLRAAERMQRMISELLDFTRNRPESGLPIQPQLSDFGAIVRASWAEIRLGHPDRAVDLRIEGQCDGLWDRDRLAQLCSNLLGNAIEHSTPGSTIEVQLTATPRQAQLRVANQGLAIPPELLPTLFQPFRRGLGATSPNGSLGLGLYIVEQIVQAHSGTVTARSDASRTEFIVCLPREPGPTLASTGPISGHERRG